MRCLRVRKIRGKFTTDRYVGLQLENLLRRSKDFYAGKKLKNIMTQTKTTAVRPDKIRTGSFLAFN